MLSRAFIQIEKRSSSVYKRFKGMLPRRESERRSHPLSRHCDILSAVDTRISMLNMTYMRYIDNNLICFIPGKVLDEVQSILNLVESGAVPPRTHELLQELRDISSMAMEHFDEHILPRLNKSQTSQSHDVVLPPAVKSISKLLLVQTTEIRRLKKKNILQRQQIQLLTQQMQKVARKVKRQNVRLKSQNNKIREQEGKIQNNENKINEHEVTINDLKKQIEEWDQKIVELTTEMNRAREETQKLPETPAELVDEKLFKTNIKPRISHITLPTVARDFIRKRQSTLTLDAAVPSKILKNYQDKNDISALIDENITKNISKTVTDKFSIKKFALSKRKPTNDCSNNNKSAGNGNNCGSISTFRPPDFSQFFCGSLGSLLLNPISSIRSRKRKISDIST